MSRGCTRSQACGHSHPVAGGHSARGDLRVRPRRRVSERHLSAMLRGRPSGRGGAGSCITRSLRSRPQQIHGEVPEQVGKPGHVVTGVEDDQDGRVPQCPASISRVTTSRTCAAVTSVSSSSGPRCTASSTAVYEVRPGSRAPVTDLRPARDHLRLALPSPVDVAEQPRRAGHRARARRPGSFSFLAGTVPANLADFLVDGPAPSWLVRVGTCLALHFPGSHRLCLDRPGLLVHELGRRLFAILSGPAAKEAHSAAKKTHSAIISRPARGLLASSGADQPACPSISYVPEAIGRVARLRVPR